MTEQFANGQYTRDAMPPLVHHEDDDPTAQLAADAPAGVVPKFYIKHTRKPVNDPDNPDGFVWITKPMIRMHVAGDSRAVCEQKVTAKHAKRYPDAYQRFMKGQQMIHQGTPLEAWPQVMNHEGFAEVCHLNHVYTVEALAEVNEANCQNLGPSGLTMRAHARAYVEAKKTNAPLDRMQAENRDLERQLREARAEINEANDRAEKQRGDLDIMRDQIAQMNEMMAEMRQMRGEAAPLNDEAAEPDHEGDWPEAVAGGAAAHADEYDEAGA